MQAWCATALVRGKHTQTSQARHILQRTAGLTQRLALVDGGDQAIDQAAMAIEIGRRVAQLRPVSGDRVWIGHSAALLQPLGQTGGHGMAQCNGGGLVLRAEAAVLLQQAQNFQVFQQCPYAQIAHALGVAGSGHAVQVTAEQQQGAGDRHGRGYGHLEAPQPWARSAQQKRRPIRMRTCSRGRLCLCRHLRWFGLSSQASGLPVPRLTLAGQCDATRLGRSGVSRQRWRTMIRCSACPPLVQ